ncbi:alpha/beta hydrolase family protein [Bacillus thuringiensis]|uniref:alpha/beta hydrolase family protein n=1 Tax=Bacillus thuringiensis TaxID=1428 RepID=UPI00159BAA35|nr:alpha/beta fold hydrolase [Bacillus thuringiensis]
MGVQIKSEISDVEWCDGFTITSNGNLIASWNEKKSVSLKVIEDNKEYKLISNCDYNQLFPVANSNFVAYYIETEEGFKLCCYDIQESKVYYPVDSCTPRPYNIVTFKNEYLITTNINPNQSVTLNLLHYKEPALSKVLIDLPKSHLWFDASPYVSEDGELFFIKRHNEINSPTANLYSLNLKETNPCECLIYKGTKTEMPIKSNVSPCNTKIICLVKTNKNIKAKIIDNSSRNIEELKTPSLRDIPIWYPNSNNKLLLTLDEWPYANFAMYDLAKGEIGKINFLSNLNTLSPQFYKEKLYFLAMGPGHPLAIYQTDTEFKNFHKITNNSSDVLVPNAEVVNIPTANNYSLPCILYRSNKRSKKIVFMFHGGPAGCWQAGWSPVVDNLLCNDINVLLINTRGSTIKEHYLPQLKPGEFGSKDVEDIQYCIQYCYENNLAALGSIGTYGHSYGSYLAVSSAIQYKEHISSCVITSGFIHPSLLWKSNDKAVVNFAKYAFLNELESPKEKISLCPILQVHGESDQQLQIKTSKKAFDNLISCKKSSFIELKGEGHVFRSKENIEYWINRATYHFLENL